MYDQPEYDPFWAAVEELDTVVYMHPRTPTPGQNKKLWEGRPALLTAPLSFGQDVQRHALGLCVNGVFDRFPGVKFVIGHLGEMIPAHLWRLGTSTPQTHSTVFLPFPQCSLSTVFPFLPFPRAEHLLSHTY